MRFLLFILIGLGVCLVTGCGRKLTPVSSTTVKTAEQDTLLALINKNSDSTTFIEKYTPKVLHGATAEITTNIRQLDSLVSVLRAMPKGIDTVYLTDAKKDVALKAYVDRLTHQLVLQCQSRDKVYFEKETYYQRTIKQLTDSLTRITSKQTTDTNTVVKEEKTLWQGLRETLNYLLWLVIIVLAIAAIGLIDKLFVWIKNKFPTSK